MYSKLKRNYIRTINCFVKIINFRHKCRAILHVKLINQFKEEEKEAEEEKKI